MSLIILIMNLYNHAHIARHLGWWIYIYIERERERERERVDLSSSSGLR
jgi:hypothetical protein